MVTLENKVSTQEENPVFELPLHEEETWTPLLQHFENQCKQFRDFVDQFESLIQKTPFCMGLKTWLKRETISKEKKEEIKQLLRILFAKNIFHVKETNGNYWMIESYQRLGHENIINSIRTLIRFSQEEKERMVESYLDFALDFSEMTLGMVSKPTDPDAKKAERRVIPLKIFWQLSQLLSERDSLIAALMYFCGRTLMEVLNLTIDQIHFDKGTVNFRSVCIEVPQHVIYRLKPFVVNKLPEELVFTNRKGMAVNRSHIFIAFKMASSKLEKLGVNYEISPASLIESLS